jgi:hypothetical protein
MIGADIGYLVLKALNEEFGRPLRRVQDRYKDSTCRKLRQINLYRVNFSLSSADFYEAPVAPVRAAE